MPILTDAALEAEVVAATRGDRDAFARLVAATSSLVTAITLSETRDVELAHDAAQDVYLRVWGGLGQLRDPGSFLPWLRQAARRQARRLSVQRARRARGREADAALAEAPDAGPGPRERLLDGERAALVRTALESLPDEARETLILYYREGHSTAQVARLLGLSDAAVQQRLSRARSRVREEVLQRLGEALERTGPAAAFTVAVVALLAPRTAVAASAQAAGGLLAALQVPKAAIAAAAAVLAALGFLFLGGPLRPGGGGPPTVTIARPAGERAPGEPARETPRIESPAVGDGALEVRVTAAGRPTPGAVVRIYTYVPTDAGTSRPAWRLLASATADVAGLTRVPASPGAYLVVARATAFAPGQLTVVRPFGEPVTRVDVALEAAVALAGRTIDRAGQPVPLASLSLMRLGEPGAPRVDLPAEERFYAASDARGAFGIDGLAPGRWQLTAEAPGHARTTVDRLTLPHSSPLDVQLGSAGVIEGLVVTADGKPAPGAEVRFAGGTELVQVESGPSGGFAAELAPGSYRVSAVRGEEAGWVDRTVSAGDRAAVKGLVIRLGTGARFLGRVVDSKDAPVGGAQVLITPFGATGEFTRLESGADGRFLSPAMPPGEYDLDASADGKAPRTERGLVLLAGQRFELTLKLTGTGAIAGTVRGTTGGPLAGVRIRGGLRRGSSFGQVDGEAVTDGDGRYRLDRLTPGVVAVTARRGEEALGANRNVEVRADDAAAADFVLPSPGAVEGTVTMADGTPLPEEISVQVGPDQGGWSYREMYRAAITAAGTFQLLLPAGRWQASSWSSGLTAKTRRRTRFTVEPGATTHLALKLESITKDPIFLRVLVLEPGGAPSSGATLEVMAPPGAAISTYTNVQGIAEVGIGTSTRDTSPLLVTARNGGRRAVHVPVAPGVKEATIQLQPGAQLSGRLEATGAPFTGFTLRLEYAPLPPLKYADSEQRRFTGDRFLLPDVPAGEATLIASTDDGRSGRATVTLRSGEPTEVKLPVASSGRIRVRILDQDGRPEPVAYLMVGGRMVDASPDGLDYDPALVRNGALMATEVPPGSVELEIGARCFEHVERRVEVRPGETLDLGDVTLKPLPPASCGR